MPRRSLPLAKAYQLLEPGPVVLLTTARDGRTNVMPMSWHCMLEFEPPLVGCVVSNRNFSFGLLRATGECVLNIPTVDIARQVVGCGNTSGAKTDKLKRFGLTASPAKRVQAPLIDECYASLECQVVDTSLVAKYGFFVLRVVHAWKDSSVKPAQTIHHLGYGKFMVAGESIKLPSKMR